MHLQALASEDREPSTTPHFPAVSRKAEEQLRASGYMALRDVSCAASDDVIYLQGCLPSHYLKQLAQEIASGVEGVRQVINRIEVKARVSQARPGRRARVYESIGTEQH